MARVRAVVALSVLSFGATAKDATWHVETVDPTMGKFSSMKMDRVGNAHVCYVDGAGKALKYAYGDHSSRQWFTMVIDEGPNGCSLALDSKQHPHICYVDYGTGIGSRLRYAHWDGKEWKKEPLQLNSEVIAYYSSIALDANDNPTISFYEYRGVRGTENKIRLRTVAFNGKYWEVTTVDPEEGSGKVNTMASDSKGHLHLAYANVATGEMRYAFWNGTAWSRREIVDGRSQSIHYVGLACAVATDKADRPHVVYVDATALLVKYAVRNAAGWTTEVVDAVGGLSPDFDRSSIALDEQGRPYLGYYDPGRGVLKVAHKEGQKWIVETVDGNGVGFTSSMQISGGVLWITYSDLAMNTLKAAHRELNAGDVSGTPESSGPRSANARTEPVKK